MQTRSQTNAERKYFNVLAAKKKHKLLRTSPVVWVRRTQPGTTFGGAEAKLPLHKECSEKLVVGGYEERKPPDQNHQRIL
jgi:hypothetical protein